MWYIADLYFESVPAAEGEAGVYESCAVLLEAPTALDVVERARAWAVDHVAGSAAEFLGIAALWSLDDERPGDGTEIAGSFFDGAKDEVRRRIPHPSELSAVRLEGIDSRRPLRELLSPADVRRFERMHDDEE